MLKNNRLALDALKAIIFDFDGVLAESVEIKTMAFRELFKDYPEELKQFIPYHLKHSGISRFAKIRYFFQELKKEQLSDQRLNELCARYSSLVVDQVVNAPFVKGALDLLGHCRGKYRLFVISGTPEAEMRLIIRRRKMEHYFDGVYGSPKKKIEILKGIIRDNALNTRQMVFFGDALTDLEAAEYFDMPFIARIDDSNKSFFEGKKTITLRIRDLAEADALFRTQHSKV